MIGLHRKYSDRPYYDIFEIREATVLELELVDLRPDVIWHEGRKVRLLPNELYGDYLMVTLAAINFIEVSDEKTQSSVEVYKAEMKLREALQLAGYRV